MDYKVLEPVPPFEIPGSTEYRIYRQELIIIHTGGIQVDVIRNQHQLISRIPSSICASTTCDPGTAAVTLAACRPLQLMRKL
jgi:hypothetical protein